MFIISLNWESKHTRKTYKVILKEWVDDLTYSHIDNDNRKKKSSSMYAILSLGGIFEARSAFFSDVISMSEFFRRILRLNFI